MPAESRGEGTGGMERLKMYWRRQPIGSPVWPDGFCARPFDGSKDDMERWLVICKEGLLGPDAGEPEFRRSMLEHPDLDTRNIVLVEKDGEPAATITAVVHPLQSLGYIHMAACREKFRGYGLSQPMNTAALGVIWDAGCRGAYLTTDDFCTQAIRSYLRAGFLPVLYQEDMAQRWAVVLQGMGIHNVRALSETGDFLQLLLPGVDTAPALIKERKRTPQ